MRHILCLLIVAMCLVLGDAATSAIKPDDSQAASTNAKDPEDASTEENSDSNDDTDNTSTEAPPKEGTALKTDSARQEQSASRPNHDSGSESNPPVDSGGATTNTELKTGRQDSHPPSHGPTATGHDSNSIDTGNAHVSKQQPARGSDGPQEQKSAEMSKRRMSSQDTEGSTGNKGNSENSSKAQNTGNGKANSGKDGNTAPSKKISSKTDTETNMKEHREGKANKGVPHSTKISRDEATKKIQGTHTPTSPALPQTQDTTENTEPTTLPTMFPNGKVYKKLPILTEAKALPPVHSVEKTDGILGSSSLFALAALATLAVAAAAPAH